MRIIGIHDGHNSSASLIEDGILKYCIQEERLTNKKNYWGFPLKSVTEILKAEKISVGDIDKFALASFHSPKPSDVLNDYKNCAKAFKNIIAALEMKTPAYAIYKKLRRKQRLAEVKSVLDIGTDKIEFIEHHTCHAASAYYGAPWNDEKVLVLTCDGSGDGLCATVSIGENGTLKRIAATPKGNSIGNIYSNITFMLGLVPWEHEWKIMGMAPYSPEYGKSKSYDVLKKYLSVDEETLTFKRNIPEPTCFIYPRLRRELEFQRFDWISAGVQELAENILIKWVKSAIAKTGIRKVCLSGGVFMNVKVNKKIMELDEVDDIFVFPSCGDESNSIGAAFHAYRQLSGKMPDPIGPIYLGRESSEIDIETALKNKKLTYQKHQDIERKIAELLAEGKIIARCKGRMEFGARALGNRSILADPSNQDVVRIINMMVKKRDFWMPFAPVIRVEKQAEYINNPKGAKSPYMMLSFDSTEKRSEFIGGVHQSDLTARAQIIEEAYNPEYYKVLRIFGELTGRNVLLNTSFNLHGYPMVNTPDDAIWVFENSGLEYLAIGNYLVYKR